MSPGDAFRPFDDARQYELLTQAVYQAILAMEGADNIEVEHNVVRNGRSGAGHQCDVFWKFRLAGTDHAVAVECKCFDRAVELAHVRSFFAVLHDLGNTQGILVTTKGYQAGAQRFAEHYGIRLKRLRTPKISDWDGRIRKILSTVVLRWFDERKGLNLKLILDADGGTQSRIHHAQKRLAFSMEEGPTARLYYQDGIPATPEFGAWVVTASTLAKRHNGGPYRDDIPTPGLYSRVTLDGVPELILVDHVELSYYVKDLARETVVADAARLVRAVLEDFVTGKIDHFHSET